MKARIDIQLDPDILSKVVAELRLTNPPTFTLNASEKVDGKEFGEKGIKRVRGLYDPRTNHVTIASQRPAHQREGLYVLTKHLRFTVLHELRHAWQREHWTATEQHAAVAGAYADRHEEHDADDWAEYAMPKYAGLVKVTRSQIGQSGFARMTNNARRQTG